MMDAQKGNRMTKKKRRNWRDEPYEKRCENCYIATRIADQNAWMCEDNGEIVIKNYKRTDKYMWCVERKVKKWEGNQR